MQGELAMYKRCVLPALTLLLCTGCFNFIPLLGAQQSRLTLPEMPNDAPWSAPYTPLLDPEQQDEELDQFRKRVETIFSRTNWGQMEAVVREAMDDSIYLPEGGNWSSVLFSHINLIAKGYMLRDEEEFLKLLDEWERNIPGSIPQRMVRVKALIQKAWLKRGPGFANTVTRAGRADFHAYLGEAEALALQLIEDGAAHPELYADLIYISMGTGTIDDRLRYFVEGLKLDPLYPPLYSKFAFSFTERWGGRIADYPRLAEFAAAHTRARTGNAAAYYLALEFAAMEGLRPVMHHFAWEDLAAGYADFSRIFPETTYHLNYIARMACTKGEREEAQKLFVRLEGPDEDVWVRPLYEQWRAWALEDGPRPAATELHAAAYAGDTKRARKALEDGVRIEAFDDTGHTALYYAIRENQWGVVRLLLEHGADPNDRSVSGAGALLMAVSNEDLGIATLLLERGADVNYAFESGWTALHSALETNNRSLMTFLLKQPGINIEGPLLEYPSPLSRAAMLGRTEFIRMLHEHGASVESLSDSFDPPLVLAATANHVEAVALLLELGAEVDAGNARGWSALFAAVDNDRREIVHMLLDAGANAAQAQEDGWTPAHTAAMTGHSELLELLLDQPGVDINALTRNGRGLVHQSIRSNHLGTLQLLVERGARLDIPYRDSEDALAFARDLGRPEIEAYLLTHVAK